jgi:DNA modification methylase
MEAHVADHLKEMLVDMNTIAPDPANARLHPERNLDSIRGSLVKFKQQKPIVVDARGIIIAGNGMYMAARQLGWTHIAAVRTTLAGMEAAGYGIADNQTALTSEWDEGALAAMVRELKVGDFDMTALGFDEDELASLLAPPGTAGLTDPDAIPAAPDAAITQPGDLWVLGTHRLLCGDSSSAAALDRLLAGAPVHLVNTDPPYNVKVEPRSNNAIAAGGSGLPHPDGAAPAGLTHHQSFDVARSGAKIATTDKLRPRDRALVNDFLSDDDFARMLLAWFGNIARVLAPGRSFYIWGGYANLGNYPPALKACDLYFSQGIVWDKQHPVLTRKDFMGAFEICFYGWRMGAGHEWFGPNNATDLWHIKKVNPASMVHLTEKPVELATRAIEYSSRPGENVLDLFGGSGSTLIGCEKTGRRAYLMELDALYCDVIVTRWEQFTGKKAIREIADCGVQNAE